MRKKSEIKGSSLLELMVWITLVGLLSVFSYPVISSLLSASNSARREALRLKTTIEKATLLAVQGEKTFRLILSSNHYQLRGKAEPYLRESHKLPPAVSLQLGSKDNKIIRFYKSGVNTPSSILLVDKISSCQVVVSLRGRVRIKC